MKKSIRYILIFAGFIIVFCLFVTKTVLKGTDISSLGFNVGAYLFLV